VRRRRGAQKEALESAGVGSLEKRRRITNSWKAPELSKQKRGRARCAGFRKCALKNPALDAAPTQHTSRGMGT